MAIAATCGMFAFKYSGSVHAGGIRFNGADRANPRRGRLPGAMAGSAGLSLATLVHEGSWLACRHHVMYVTVTTRTRRQYCVGETLQNVLAMNARVVLGQYLGMTVPTVDRIEPTTVPAFVGADMAIEAFRLSVHGALVVGDVDLVAIVTGVFLVRVGRLQPERQAHEERYEGGKGLAHG